MLEALSVLVQTGSLIRCAFAKPAESVVHADQESRRYRKRVEIHIKSKRARDLAGSVSSITCASASRGGRVVERAGHFRFNSLHGAGADAAKLGGF